MSQNKELMLLKAINEIDEPSIHDLIESTAMPKTTLTRYLKLLRDVYLIDIRYVKNPAGEHSGSNKKSGYYVIFDWGIIDRREFSLRYSN